MERVATNGRIITFMKVNFKMTPERVKAPITGPAASDMKGSGQMINAAVEAADAIERAGVSVDRVAIGGEVARKILRVAADRSVDSVAMGGRKRSGLQEVLMGSTTQDVLLSAERPVTITG